MRCVGVEVVLLFSVSLIVCQEEGFHCKPKLGCRIAKCDAAPFGTFGRIEDYLERSEFPISCKLKDDGGILSQIADIQEEMVDLKTENQLLRKRLQSVESDYKKEIRKLAQKIEKLEDREERMTKKMQDVKGIELQMQEISKEMADIKKKGEAAAWCDSENGMAYNGSCLWAESTPTGMSLSTALKTCNDKAPSKLPDIYGETEYQKIMEYLRSKIPDGENVVFAWTGMTRDHLTGRAVLSNGEYAPYTKPRTMSRVWTTADRSRTQAYLRADRNSSTDQGMGSYSPGRELNSVSQTVLCQTI